MPHSPARRSASTPMAAEQALAVVGPAASQVALKIELAAEHGHH